MVLKKSFKNIKNFILQRYKDNLAAVLVYGSANTGEFKSGESDIDTIILLKNKNNLDFEKERKFLINKLKKENFWTQYFYTLKELEEYIKKRGSWGLCIAILTKEGSKVLHSTPEFEKFKGQLQKNFLSKNKIKRYIQDKNKTDLECYFKKTREFVLTKSLFAHLRKILQIIQYFQSKKLIFDYKRCIDKLDLKISEKEQLKNLYNSYKKRRRLNKKEVEEYYLLSYNLTKRILNE